MGKLFSYILTGLMIVAVLVVVLKMVGLGDKVDEVGRDLVGRIGGDGADPSEKDFAKDVLGWDIREIKSKPVAVVEDGKRRLQKTIDDLERAKLQNQMAVEEMKLKDEDLLSEMKELRESMIAARSFLKDPNTVYPVKIGSYSYASADVLRKAVDNARARYITVTNSLSYSQAVNSTPRSEALTSQIKAKLEAAYALMAVLDSKLSLAGVKEREDELDGYLKTFTDLQGKAQTIFPEDEETKMPGKAKSDESKIDDFLDTL